jgi:hypothetical protein
MVMGNCRLGMELERRPQTGLRWRPVEVAEDEIKPKITVEEFLAAVTAVSHASVLVNVVTAPCRWWPQ